MNLTVKYIGGKRFEASCRSHKITIDPPESVGGTDEGMNPVELLIASVASCAAYFAMTFLSRRVEELAGLEVRCGWQYSEDPHRVGIMDLTIVLPADLGERDKEGLPRAVDDCAVKSTLEHPPRIRVTTSAT